MSTMFTPILQRALERVPGAVGAVFADWDGEAVDWVGGLPRDEMLVLGAHYGVILNTVQSALHTFHFGEADEVIMLHDKLDVIVRTVGRGYYVVLAVAAGMHLATARREVDAAASALRSEIV